MRLLSLLLVTLTMMCATTSTHAHSMLPSPKSANEVYCGTVTITIGFFSISADVCCGYISSMGGIIGPGCYVVPNNATEPVQTNAVKFRNWGSIYAQVVGSGIPVSNIQATFATDQYFVTDALGDWYIKKGTYHVSPSGHMRVNFVLK